MRLPTTFASLLLFPTTYLLLPLTLPPFYAVSALAQTTRTLLTGTLDSSSSTLKNGSYYNLHTFQGKAGDAISIDMVSPTLDIYLILLNPNNESIGNDDNSGEGTNARLVITLPTTGTYTIIASETHPRAKGNYTLSLRPANPNDLARAAELAKAAQLSRQGESLYLNGQHVEAISTYQRALTIYEEALGSDHYYVAETLNNLANLYYDQGNYREAEPLYQRALSIREKVLGADDYYVADTLNNLALLYYNQGDYEGAEPLLQRALTISKKLPRAQPPFVAMIMNNLALLKQAQGDLVTAITLQNQVMDVDEHTLDLFMAMGSEQQKQTYMANLSNSTMRTISLHLQGAPTNLAAARLALTTILRRKGRILDALRQSLHAIRQSQDPQDQNLLQDMLATRSQLSALVYRGAGNTSPEVYRTQIQTLERQANQLEATFNNRHIQFHQESPPVTIEAVQRLIPAEAALIEFMVYKPFDPKATSETWGNPRYAAYVLHATGEPQWVDLGEASVIDTALQLFKSILTNTDESLAQIKQASRQVDALLMQPIRPLLGKSTTLLLSPDSQLNLMSFGALVDQQNRWLIETYTLVYLSSGRDLLRFQTPMISRQPPLVIANPDYDLTVSTEGTENNQRSVDLANLSFNNLVFTQAEGEAIAHLLPKARLLTGTQASEAAINQVQGASVVHIATHGFFLPDRLNIRGDDRPGVLTPSVTADNPLVRSGLALAGANSRRGDGGDGILTALEVTALNLLGTKLVVLSACDTGKGVIANGEGVYGLRRAFMLAGAESLVMTLWSVDDQATQELMIAYYTNLKQGMDRVEALRQVQLAMINSNDYWHPVYWAAFVPSGQWAPMVF